MEEEKSIIIIPKCEKKKMLSGRTEFYNLIVTDRRVIGAKTGGTFFATRGLAGAVVKKVAKDRQDIAKFAGKDLEEIIRLDRNNWAIPFAGFNEIKIGKQVGPGAQGLIRFKLNKEGKKLDLHSSVPRFLVFDKKYLQELQATLSNLAGKIIRT
jgi:hypothetical protein